MKTKQFLLMIALLAIGTASAQKTTYNGIVYMLNKQNHTATVSESTNDLPEDVTIPASITADNAVYSVTAIAPRAFEKNSKVKSIQLPASLTEIGTAAFSECDKLTGITIPNGVTIIQGSTFSLCSSLATVNLPGGIIIIEKQAFEGCIGLKSIKLPSKLKSIGAYAFTGCRFSDLIIPEEVTNIGDAAFIACINLKTIKLPGSLNTIGTFAFQGCAELTDITIPDGVTSLGTEALGQCTKLKSITLPGKLKTIEIALFRECSELTEITIPDGVTRIETRAFAQCTKLKTIKLSSKLDFLGQEAFSHCTELTNIVIPASTTILGELAFNECYSLASITVDKDNPAYTDIEGVVFNKAKTDLIAYPIGKEASRYAIPEGVTSIKKGAFYASGKLASVEIPGSLTLIEENVFTLCTALTDISVSSINSVYTSTAGVLFSKGKTILHTYPIGKEESHYQIPQGTVEIAYGAFNSAKFTSVDIPSTVTSISERGFEQCKDLTSIFCAAQTPPTIDEYTFTSYTPVLYVPKGCQAAYRSAQYWKNFTEIKEGESDISAVQAENGIIYSDGHLTLPYAQTAEVAIYSSTGTQAGNYLLSAGESCDLNFLPVGIYIIKVKAGEKTMSTKIIR